MQSDIWLYIFMGVGDYNDLNTRKFWVRRYKESGCTRTVTATHTGFTEHQNICQMPLSNTFVLAQC